MGRDTDKYIVSPRGTSFWEGTAPQVIEIIDAAMQSRARLKFWFGDPKTGKNWVEEYSNVGRIGRSTGTSKIPLLIKTSRSMGGGALLTANIMKIRDVKTGGGIIPAPEI